MPPARWPDGAASDAVDHRAARARAARISTQRWRRNPSCPLDTAVRAGIRCRDKALLHLHLGHDRPAQGREYQPHAHAVHDARFRGRDERRRRTTACTTLLPLYHSTGGVCAPGVGLDWRAARSSSAANSPRHEFWDDCFKYKPTSFQYIGELCRYLLNAPPSAHRARSRDSRVVIGNGLRPEIWPALPGALRDPEDHRVLRRHRRQCLDAQLSTARSAPSAACPCYMRKAFNDTRIVRFDIEQREAGARRRRSLHRMRAAAKSAKRSARSTQRAAAAASRATRSKADTREENPARCLRERRRAGFAPAI